MEEEFFVSEYRMSKEIKKEDYDFHSHDTYEVYFFHSGRCKYMIGDEIHHLQENDIIIMDGLTLHRPYPEEEQPYIRSVIQFSGEWLKPVLANLKVPELLNPFYMLNNCLFRGVDQDMLLEIEELIKKIAQVGFSKGYKQEDKFENRLKEGEVTTLLVQLLFKIYELSKLRIVKIPSVKSEKHMHVDRIIRWVEDNREKNIKLDDIAKSLSISKYYMSRIFKCVTGFTIMEYLMSCRIKRAKYLLEMHPEMSILEVALESGFENSSHFSRFFRKQVKITPTAYRNERTISEALDQIGNY
ncbi:AraC-like ligand binding domain-containing protein [Fictibacillus enclensis]|nr:helix-turn-helix domain-containing protein [Fictibacillus enclensis]SCC38596.1 AraC-like ligand binding domain-containing protein [Fictibacillus enclensis]